MKLTLERRPADAYIPVTHPAAAFLRSPNPQSPIARAKAAAPRKPKAAVDVAKVAQPARPRAATTAARAKGVAIGASSFAHLVAPNAGRDAARAARDAASARKPTLAEKIAAANKKFGL